MTIRPVKILFLPVPAGVIDWYGGFVAAIEVPHIDSVYDPARPMDEQFRGIDMVVEHRGCSMEMIDAAHAAGVKLWQVLSTGLDKWDVAYFLEKGVPFANTPGIFSAIALAEHALFLMLSLAKNFAASQKTLRSKGFNWPINTELQGRTLGLIGLGASGREVAKRAGCMGMRVLAIDAREIPQAVRDELRLGFLGKPDQLDRILAEADYVSLHTSLTSQTRHLMNQRAFGLMKKTAVLINVARGAIIDEVALIEALRSGRIAGAGLDVFAQEPIDPEHPLLHMDNVVCTPHIAGVTFETQRRRWQAAAENVARIAQGLPPLYQITSADS